MPSRTKMLDARVSVMGENFQGNKAGAFQWLDAFFYTPADEGSPDEAFDWVFMMHEEDWRLLEQAWPGRPTVWRESCAYLLGEGPIPESLPLLRRALFDEEPDVAKQAACSLAGQRLAHGELVELDDRILSRLRGLLALFGGSHMEEVVEVLRAADHD